MLHPSVISKGQLETYAPSCESLTRQPNNAAGVHVPFRAMFELGPSRNPTNSITDDGRSLAVLVLCRCRIDCWFKLPVS